MSVHAVLFHGDMEHLRSGSAVNVAALCKNFLPPMLSGDPRNDPCLDGREVCHIKSAAGFRHKSSADKLGQHQRHGVIEHFHGIRIAAADQCPCDVQIRQMVLGQILHLDEPTGIASGAIGTVKLDKPSGTVIRTDYRLHGGVFLDAALGKLLPQGEGKLHFAVRFFKHFCHGSFGERIRFHAFLGKPRLELHRTVGVIQAGHRARLLHVRPLEAFIAADCLGDKSTIKHDTPFVDLLVEGVVAPL